MRRKQGQRITDVELKIPIESLEELASGRIYGSVHLQMADVEFPSAKWSDFVAVVLSFWCDGLAKVLAEPDQTVDVRFMEGPFLVRLGPIVNAKIVVSLIDNGSPGAVGEPTEVSLEPLMRNALQTTRAVIDRCRSWRFSSSDIEQLVVSRDHLVRACGMATLT